MLGLPLAIGPHVSGEWDTLAGHNCTHSSSVVQSVRNMHGWNRHVAHVTETEARELDRVRLEDLLLEDAHVFGQLNWRRRVRVTTEARALREATKSLGLMGL